MNDLENLQDYDAACFPTLKSALDLDGLTLEEMLKASHFEPFCYSKKKQGWFEWLSYAGLTYLVLVHGSQKHFAWKDVCRWRFHAGTHLDESDFEIWLKQKSELTK